MMHVTRRYRFSASHRLHSETLPEDRNREVYGKCNNQHGHGHDYVLDVGVVGPLEESTGQVVNIAALDDLVRRYVLQDFEHRNLNVDVPDFQDIVPTSENLAFAIRDRLATHWSDVFPQAQPRLETIRLQETKRNHFELRA